MYKIATVLQKLHVKKVRHIFAILLISFIFFTIFSENIEKHHHCCGENCPVCCVLQICSFNIKLLLLVISLSVLHFAVLSSTKKIKIIININRYRINTLLYQKTCFTS